MADKPKDNKPATEFGEVKVIKNEREVDPGKTPGLAEGGAPAPTPPRDNAGETPDEAEG